MTERPILFSGEMVRAILDGRKTQTRRIVKHIESHSVGKTAEHRFIDCVRLKIGGLADPGSPAHLEECPYGQPGDRLWVRESWSPMDDRPELKALGGVYYAVNENRDSKRKWKPSIHMPRWASRITLEITDVRVERVQDITDLDACDEGALGVDTEKVRPGYSESVRDAEQKKIRPPLGPGPRERFEWLWDSINAKRGYGWDMNPWVWVIEFKRIL
jgi:hypothetical protein